MSTSPQRWWSIGLVIAFVILGFAIGAGSYLTSKHENRVSALPIRLSSSTTEIASNPVSSSTAHNSITIPYNSFTSRDEQWIAFEATPYANTLIENPVDSTATIGELDILNSGQSVIKTFTPAQLYVSSTCDCSVAILGWGNGILWLETMPNEEAPIISFLKINTADWSITNYPANADLSFRSEINFDTGKFIVTDLPWGPNQDDDPTNDTSTYSVSIYDIQTGTSQIIETTTLRLADAARATFGLDLTWLDDNTLQYYDFHSDGATTTVSN